jgi:hypothetical protein
VYHFHHKDAKIHTLQKAHNSEKEIRYLLLDEKKVGDHTLSMMTQSEREWIKHNGGNTVYLTLFISFKERSLGNYNIYIRCFLNTLLF